MLSLATRGSFLRLVRCEEGRHLYDSVVVKGERLPVTPDAFFTLEDSRRPAGRNLADFFLEADRTTETWPKQFQNKVRAYWCYLKDGPHENKFNEEKITITNQLGAGSCTIQQRRRSDRKGRVTLSNFQKSRLSDLCTGSIHELAEEEAFSFDKNV